MKQNKASFLYNVVLSAFCLNVGFEAQFLTVGDVFASVPGSFDKLLSCLISKSLLYLRTPTQIHIFSFALIHSSSLELKGKRLLISSELLTWSLHLCLDLRVWARSRDLNFNAVFSNYACQV